VTDRTFKRAQVPADTRHVVSPAIAWSPDTRITRAVVALGVVAGLGMTAFLAYSFLGRGDPSADRAFNDGIYNALLLIAFAGCLLRVLSVPVDRPPWLFITAGVASWVAGDFCYAFVFANDPPFPSFADALYLAFYPLAYIGLLLLVRTHIADFKRSLWLDGITATLGSAAVGAAVLVEVVLQDTEGSPATVITNLAYPIGDVLLLSLVVGVFALAGWRPGKMWLLVGLAFACSAITDALFVFQQATDSYVPGGWTDALWPATVLLIAWAAWQPPVKPRGGTREARPWLITTALAGFVGVSILVYDHASRLNLLALGLAVATLAMVMVRTWLTLGENAAVLDQIRRQAATDALTGLGNRRSLIVDLEHALAAGSGAEPRILVIFDLNGFKRYNDTYGHPSGDTLLRRLGGKLAASVEHVGAAYRLGGDEFCVLASVTRENPALLLDNTSSALSESGEGFAVTASFGAVFLPDEALDFSEALRLADERLYAQKHATELLRSRPHEVLLQAISEREPELWEHSRSVAELSLELGRRVNLPESALSELRIAAELHDVGKLAVPDAILEKRGSLTAEERAFVERHTLVGQRIVAAAPALQRVGKIVRASHERWDGTGYVDGLAGEEIPLEARIIAVCDAFKAMTTDRPYAQPMSARDALYELQRRAGTQFDPAVVDALVTAADRGELDVGLRSSPSAPGPPAATRAS
jgi:two-component system cell cycle response regulator